MLTVSGDNVVVSALKPGKEGRVVLRVYEAGGKAAANVRAQWLVPINGVHESNFVEDKGEGVDSERDGFVFSLRPFEIRTFQVAIKAQPES